MNPRIAFPAPALALCAAALAGSLIGCSRKAGSDAAAKQADEYFAKGDFVKAELEYKNALAQNNNNAHAISRMGVAYFEQGRLSLAYRFLRRALELRPDDLEAKFKLALFDLGNGKPADARQAAIAILEKNPRHAEAPMILVDTIIKSEDMADTRSRLARLPGGAAEAPPALLALALLELRTGKLKEAETLIDRARKLDPRSAVAASVLGQLRMAQKDLTGAGKAFAEAADLAPPRSQLRVQYARFQLQNGHAAEGRKLLEESIARTPDFLPPYLVLAGVAESEKKYEEAVGLLDKVLTKDAEHPEAMLLMGQVRLNMGEREKAVTILERAVALYPRSYMMHHQLGLAQIASGNFGAAAASLNQALRAAPGFMPAAFALTRLQIGQGDFAAAVRTVSPFARVTPEITEARLLLAAALRGQGALDEAVKIYRQLAQANPKVPEHRFLEATVLLQQEKPEEARRAFTAASEAAPDFLPAVEALANLDISEGRFPSAIERLRTFIASHPQSGPAHLALAGAYLRQPDNAKAEETLLKLIQIDPDNAGGYNLLSKLYVDTRQVDKAIAKLTESTSRNPKDAAASYVLGTMHEAQKNFPAARDAYTKAIAANPKMGQALNNLAYIYSEHVVDLDKALDAAQRAREALPAVPEIADTLGWIFFKKRQYSRALALIQECAEKVPDNVDVQFHLGLAAYMSGKEALARKALERALGSKREFAGADEARQALAILNVDAAGGAASRATLEKALAARKDDPIANLRLAAVLEQEGNADKALAAYETALKANPGLVAAIVGQMRIHAARNETAKAIALGRDARKAAPDDPQLAVALARLLYQAGDFAGSLVLVQEAVRRQPDNSDLLFDLAEAAYPMGQLTATENALNDALRALPASPRASKARQMRDLMAFAQNPSDAAAAAKAADAALKADSSNVAALMVKAALDEKQGGATKSAQQAYDQILARWPDFSPAKRRLAVLYAAMPEPPKNALDVANKAREAFPGDAELTRATGLIAFRQGNFSRASSLLQESARTITNDAELMYYLGRAQFETKDAAAGKRALQRALDLGLKDDLAKEARRLLAPSPEKK